MTNMTYAQALDNAIALFSQGGQIDVEDRETVEKLEALKGQLAKRSASKTPTKTQQANEGVKVAILEVLREADAPMTVTEILATEGMGDYTNQKISALLRQLVLAGKVEKTIEGKKAYFKAVAEEEGI